MSKKDIIEELHKPARKNFTRRRTIIKGFDDLFQIDIADLFRYSKQNRGYKYILVVIDCFSKYVWTYPLKTKTASEVSKAMEKILQKDGRVPRNLQSDNGKEFYNREFKKLMSRYNINHYSTYSVKKASIVERVIRTLKSMLYKQFSLRGKYKWDDILETVTQNYNNRKHSMTGMKPAMVKPSTKLTVYDNIKISGKPKFSVGDIVRISKYKSIFQKGYFPNWSTELFKVRKVKLTNPVTYLLDDMRGQPILGSFYNEELQKTRYSDIYLVEKVLRRKQNKVYVKWLGLDKSHNSWINKNNVL